MATIKGGPRAKAALRELARKIGKRQTLKVGFLENARYPNGTSVALAAAVNNFGAPGRGIPPRPFFTNMVAEKSPTWGASLTAIMKADPSGEHALEQMGEGIAGQLRDAIVATYDPPLSPITLMLRKMRSEDQSLEVTGATVGEAARRVAAGESTAGVSTKPLVDSSHMLNSVDYEVS